MINGKSILAVILARGRSKGIAGKNLQEVAGKSLLVRAIEQARNSTFIDRLILSSDDPTIIEVARAENCDVPFVRPAELASDTATSMDALFHALRNVEEIFDYVVLIQPTSPCRETADINNCIEKCESMGAPACVSVAELDKPWQWMYQLDHADQLRRLFDIGREPTRRQEAATGYYLNGAVYVAKWSWLHDQGGFISPETVASIMSRENSIDIDDPLDLYVAEYILRSRDIQRTD